MRKLCVYFEPENRGLYRLRPDPAAILADASDPFRVQADGSVLYAAVMDSGTTSTVRLYIATAGKRERAQWDVSLLGPSVLSQSRQGAVEKSTSLNDRFSFGATLPTAKTTFEFGNSRSRRVPPALAGRPIARRHRR